MTNKLLTLAATAALATIGAGTPTLLAAAPTFRFSKPVELPALEDEELVAVRLDSDVYEATGAALPDVRLLDAAGDETAYVIRKAVTKQSRTEQRRFTVANPKVRPQEDGSLEITFEIDAEDHPEPPLGFTLVTPLQNFERRVELFEADADGEWTSLVDDALVFDYSQYMDVHNRDLPLPPRGGSPSTADRRFRIVIDDVTQEQQSQLMELTRKLQDDDETSRTERVVVNRQPFRIDRIECWYEAEVFDVVVERKADYPLTGFRVERDAGAKATYVYVDSRREPLTELTIATADRNFSRTARVEVKGTRTPQASKLEWLETIGTGNLARLDFRNLAREDLGIGFPEAREPQYRLVIENRDSRPLEITGVKARGAVYEVVFLAQPGGRYHLAYGNATAAAPSYDTAALTASLGDGYLPLAATLGEQTASVAAPDEGEPALARLVNDPRFLGAVIMLLVVVFGVGLYQATRRLDSLPPHDSES